MIEAEPKIFKEEEEANKKLKAISEQKEREKALDLLAKKVDQSMSEEDWKNSEEKVKKQRDLKS